MKILPILCFVALFGCSPSKKHSEAASTAKDEPSSQATFDYDMLIADIRRINYDKNGYEIFQAEWVNLKSRLLSASENGSINKLAEDKRKLLWYEIEYMRACSHSKIFTDHNHEIIPILFGFDLPEFNQQLREILVESGQL
jgi:hypothetical protein